MRDGKETERSRLQVGCVADAVRPRDGNGAAARARFDGGKVGGCRVLFADRSSCQPKYRICFP